MKVQYTVAVSYLYRRLCHQCTSQYNGRALSQRKCRPFSVQVPAQKETVLMSSISYKNTFFNKKINQPITGDVTYFNAIP